MSSPTSRSWLWWRELPCSLRQRLAIAGGLTCTIALVALLLHGGSSPGVIEGSARVEAQGHQRDAGPDVGLPISATEPARSPIPQAEAPPPDAAKVPELSVQRFRSEAERRAFVAGYLLPAKSRAAQSGLQSIYCQLLGKIPRDVLSDRLRSLAWSAALAETNKQLAVHESLQLYVESGAPIPQRDRDVAFRSYAVVGEVTWSAPPGPVWPRGAILTVRFALNKDDHPAVARAHGEVVAADAAFNSALQEIKEKR